MRSPARLVLLAALLVAVAAGPLAAAGSGLSVEGTVSSVAGNTISLLDGAVRIDASTARIFSRRTGAPLGIADVLPGAEIRAAIASARPDGLLVATTIAVGNVEAVELRGKIESIDAAAGTFKLLGMPIATTSATAFSGETARGSVRRLSDLAVDDFVEVAAQRTPTGLVALSVHAEDHHPEPPEGQPVEFRGTVESQGADAWVVSGKTVKITAQTRIIGSPVVGDAVRVGALRARDGSLTALVIVKLSAEPPQGPVVEIRGRVEARGATSWTIAGKVVKVTPLTVILGNPGVGDTVEARALRAADASLTALLIKKEDD